MFLSVKERARQIASGQFQAGPSDPPEEVAPPPVTTGRLKKSRFEPKPVEPEPEPEPAPTKPKKKSSKKTKTPKLEPLEEVAPPPKSPAPLLSIPSTPKTPRTPTTPKLPKTPTTPKLPKTPTTPKPPKSSSKSKTELRTTSPKRRERSSSKSSPGRKRSTSSSPKPATTKTSSSTKKSSSRTSSPKPKPVNASPKLGSSFFGSPRIGSSRRRTSPKPAPAEATPSKSRSKPSPNVGIGSFGDESSGEEPGHSDIKSACLKQVSGVRGLSGKRLAVVTKQSSSSGEWYAALKDTSSNKYLKLWMNRSKTYETEQEALEAYLVFVKKMKNECRLFSMTPARSRSRSKSRSR